MNAVRSLVALTTALFLLTAVRCAIAERLPVYTNAPSVRVERVYFTDREGKPHDVEPPTTSPLLIPPGGRAVEVHFIPLSFASQDSIKFATLLTRNGLEIASVESDRREASYDWLPPGNYNFHVKPANYHGVWNPTGASLSFVVLPFYWQTAWFRLFVACVLIFGSAGIAWRMSHNRQLLLEERLRERQAAEESLVQEHAQRLKAEMDARSLTQRLLSVHEAERSRVARELHDDVTQRLARLAIDAALAERGVAVVSKNGKPRSMREELVRLSEDVHSLAYRLHPSILDELGLAEAIRAECDLFSRRGSLSVKFQSCDIPGKIPREAALCSFRIAQEALRNVERHAQACSVNVSLSLMDGGVQLAVRDDGIGFDPAKNRGKPTLGHASMRERLNLLQGELAIESEPGSGTTILAWVPLKGESEI